MGSIPLFPTVNDTNNNNSNNIFCIVFKYSDCEKDKQFIFQIGNCILFGVYVICFFSFLLVWSYIKCKPLKDSNDAPTSNGHYAKHSILLCGYTLLNIIHHGTLIIPPTSIILSCMSLFTFNLSHLFIFTPVYYTAYVWLEVRQINNHFYRRELDRFSKHFIMSSVFIWTTICGITIVNCIAFLLKANGRIDFFLESLSVLWAIWAVITFATFMIIIVYGCRFMCTIKSVGRRIPREMIYFVSFIVFLATFGDFSLAIWSAFEDVIDTNPIAWIVIHGFVDVMQIIVFYYYIIKIVREHYREHNKRQQASDRIQNIPTDTVSQPQKNHNSFINFSMTEST